MKRTVKNLILTAAASAILAEGAAPPAPTGVSATQGSFADRVRMKWNPVPGSTYEIWRAASASSGAASRIGTATTTTYDDLTVTRGQVFYFWVKSKNTSGVSGFSNYAAGLAVGVPAVPTGLSASKGGFVGYVHVQWNASSFASAYEVWRSPSASTASALKAGEVSAASFDDRNVNAGTTYTYFVRAKNNAGVSGFSVGDKGYAMAIPSAPTGVSASDGTYSDRVWITWNPVSGSSGYEVWRSPNASASNAIRIATPLGPPYSDQTAAPGVNYWYLVKAKNAAGVSGFSGSESGYVLAAPAAPATVSATDGSVQAAIRVTWPDVAGATGFDVFRSLSASSATAARIASVTAAPYEDLTAAPGTLYYYFIRAKNAAGSSAFSMGDAGYRLKASISEFNTAFGYDDVTDATTPWKSVEKGKSDTYRASIAPAQGARDVGFTSKSPTKVTVSPSTATNAEQTVTVGGVDKGSAAVPVNAFGFQLALAQAAVYNKLTRTVAVTLVHEKASGPGDKGYTSADLSDSAIRDALATVYRQAATSFTVVRRPAQTVEFDLNKDGKLDDSGWMTAEMQKIRDACSSGEDYNVFIVSNPSQPTVTGMANFNQKYVFIHVSSGANAFTVAHELGHALGLRHTETDSANIMWPYLGTTWRLRKAQWDTLNP